MQYYVHYVDYNKRLDEWVTEDRLDTRKIEPPQGKEEKSHAATSATTGSSTPSTANSDITGPSVLQHAILKAQEKKR